MSRGLFWFKHKNASDLSDGARVFCYPIELHGVSLIDVDARTPRAWLSEPAQRVELQTHAPDAWCVFYTHKYVLGALSGRALYANSACFALDELVRDDAIFAKKPKKKEKDVLCYIPWLIGSQMSALEHMTCTLDQITNLVHVFYARDWGRFERHPHVALATLLLLMGIPDDAEFPLLASLLRARHDWVMQRVTPANVERFLVFNGVPVEVQRFMCVTPTLRDLEGYRARFPHAENAPRFWFRAPVWELAQTFEVYPPHGDVHASVSDLGEWLWVKCCAVRRQGLTRLISLSETLVDDVRDVARACENKRGRAPTDSDFFVPDMEDLDAFLPPCLRAILSTTFPKDEARQHAVRVMARARVPLSVIQKRLDALNERDPHAQHPYPNAQKRWDYEAHYNQGYAPPRCERMSGCPFVGNEKRAQCHEQFAAEHPRAYRAEDATHFRDASAWFIWQFRHLGEKSVN